MRELYLLVCSASLLGCGNKICDECVDVAMEKGWISLRLKKEEKGENQCEF